MINEPNNFYLDFYLHHECVSKQQIENFINILSENKSKIIKVYGTIYHYGEPPKLYTRYNEDKYFSKDIQYTFYVGGHEFKMIHSNKRQFIN